MCSEARRARGLAIVSSLSLGVIRSGRGVRSSSGTCLAQCNRPVRRWWCSDYGLGRVILFVSLDELKPEY